MLGFVVCKNELKTNSKRTGFYVQKTANKRQLRPIMAREERLAPQAAGADVKFKQAFKTVA
jgi:hypothetical protein